MKRLANLHNPAFAAELLYRLDAAGIKADASPNAAPAAIYVGSTEMVVWVLDEDFDAALPILEAFTQDTRTQKETMRCHGCGYDFTGHAIRFAKPCRGQTGWTDDGCYGLRNRIIRIASGGKSSMHHRSLRSIRLPSCALAKLTQC